MLVHHEHAIAMTGHTTVHDVVAEVGDAGDRGRDLHPFVQRRGGPTVSPTARSTGHPDPLCIHLWPGLQIIECADTVPGLDPRRGVTPGVPPPHPLPIGAVVQPFDLAQLHRVDGQADIPVPGKPDSVMLISGLVAATNVVGPHRGMAADIENRRRRRAQFLRHIQIRRNVEPGHRLEMQLLHRELRMLDPSGDLGLQRGPFRHRPQT